MDKLAGRTAVVTGAASGIGRGTARAMAAHGVSVVVADIDEAGARAVAAEIEAAGGHAVGAACDVTRDAAFERLRDAALARFGRVDIVMNNAGTISCGLPEHTPVEEWRRMFDVNLLAAVRSNLAFLPLLIDQGEGHIVNTGSLAGLMVLALDRIAYAASKAAIIQLSEGLALYLKPKGIGVTVLCPGPVDTGIMNNVRAFGPARETSAPPTSSGSGFRLLDPLEVGEMVVNAIVADQFMLHTHPQTQAMLLDRAGDWDAFLNRRIARTGA